MPYQGVDLNRLEQYDLVPNMPAVRPRFVIVAPFRAPTYAALGYSHASQLGVTTLDSYVAPSIPTAQNALGNTYAIAGNGIVLAGNAPYAGIYTGIQQE
jgi:hypothetical protein